MLAKFLKLLPLCIAVPEVTTTATTSAMTNYTIPMLNITFIRNTIKTQRYLAIEESCTVKFLVAGNFKKFSLCVPLGHAKIGFVCLADGHLMVHSLDGLMSRARHTNTGYFVSSQVKRVTYHSIFS
jgi:hypothetical protein